MRPDFAKAFKALRRCLDFNQTQMAEALLCSQSTVSKIESGETEPLGMTVVRASYLARRLKVSGEVRELFERMGWV